MKMKALKQFTAPDVGAVSEGDEFDCTAERAKAFEAYGLASKMEAAPKNKMARAPKNKGAKNAD